MLRFGGFWNLSIMKKRTFTNIPKVCNTYNEIWGTFPYKNVYAQSVTIEGSSVIFSSKRKSKLLKTVEGQEKNFNDVLNLNDTRKYRRQTLRRAVFTDPFQIVIRNLLNKPVFQKVDVSWFDEFFLEN